MAAAPCMQRASCGLPGRASTACTASKGETYYRNMMANRAKRGGAFLKPDTQRKQGKDQSQPGPTSTSQQGAAGVPYDALRAYLDGALRSHWLGTPAPAWLPDEGSGAGGARARGTARTAQQVQTAGGASTSQSSGLGAGPSPQAAEASRQMQPAPYDEQAEHKAAQAARAAQQAKEAARQARGIVIPPPATLQGSGSRSLPPLPGISLPSRGRPAGSSFADVQGAPQQEGRVFVFWDLEEKHPGAVDPRLVAHRLRQAAAAYGQVCGVYAYATRKVSNWVPDALYEVAMDARAQAKQRQPAQQQDDRLRCPVCGVSRRSEAEVAAHMEALHGRRRGDGGSPAKAPSNDSNRGIGRVQRYHNSRGEAFVPPVGHQLSLRYVLRCEGVDARIAQNAREDSGLALAAGLLRLMSQLQQAEVSGFDATPMPSGSLGPLDVQEEDGEGSGAVLPPGSRPVVLVVSDDVRLVRQLSQLRDSGFSVVLASGDARLLAAAGGHVGGLDKARGGSRARDAAGAASRGLAVVAQAVLDWEALRWGEYTNAAVGV